MILRAAYGALYNFRAILIPILIFIYMILRNNVFNLMNQLVQESKSVWRIKNEYMQEAIGNDELMALWKRLESEKGAAIEEMQKILKKISA